MKPLQYDTLKALAERDAILRRWDTATDEQLRIMSLMHVQYTIGLLRSTAPGAAVNESAILEGLRFAALVGGAR